MTEVRLPSRVVTSTKENGWNATKAIALLISFIALAWWLERATGEAISHLKSIPYHYWWWGLGIASGVALIVGLLLNPARRESAGRAVRHRWVLWPVVILLLAVGTYWYLPWSTWLVGLGGYVSSPSPTTTVGGLPWETVAPIIAGCESGNGTPGTGRQFDDKGNLIKNPKSSAVGKYQIMASLHEERARGLGHNIRTEMGNEGYARYLYAESGTQHWEVDRDSRKCWESQLLALGHGTPGRSTPPPTTDTTFVVVATAVKPVEVIMPPGWMIVWWGDKAKFKSHAVWHGENKVRIFTARTGVGSAEIKIHRYYDPDPNWWRRQ